MSVKLQQAQRNYRLRNHFGMRVNNLTPRSKLLKQGQWKQNLNQPSVYCFKKSWHRLRIKETIKWRSFCRILKRLYVINVNSEYCVKRVNFLFCLKIIHYKDVLFTINDLRSSDVKKPRFWRQNSISYVLIVYLMCMCFSNDKMVQWQSLSYS